MFKLLEENIAHVHFILFLNVLIYVLCQFEALKSYLDIEFNLLSYK